jgi:hypothetical protein
MSRAAGVLVGFWAVAVVEVLVTGVMEEVLRSLKNLEGGIAMVDR